jgi:hypothetical protein
MASASSRGQHLLLRHAWTSCLVGAGGRVWQWRRSCSWRGFITAAAHAEVGPAAGGGGPQPLLLSHCCFDCCCWYSPACLLLLLRGPVWGALQAACHPPCENFSMPPSFWSMAWRMPLKMFQRYCRRRTRVCVWGGEGRWEQGMI